MGGTCSGEEDSATPTNRDHKLKSEGASSTSQPPVPIYINVYNLQQREAGEKKTKLQKIGFGIYHSGVHIGAPLNIEVAFGGAQQAAKDQPGIFCHVPRGALPEEQFHEQVKVGEIYGLTLKDLRELLHAMHPKWLARSYHLLSRNCNCFVEAFLKELSKKFGVKPEMEAPSYINRAARVGDVVVPNRILEYFMEQAPNAPSTAESKEQKKREEEEERKKQQGPRTKAEASSTSAASGAGGESTSASPTSASATPAPPPFIPGLDSERTLYVQPQVRHTFDPREMEEMLASVPLPLRDEMKIMSPSQLKLVMLVHGIDWTNCVEKEDLVNAIEAYEKTHLPSDSNFFNAIMNQNSPSNQHHHHHHHNHNPFQQRVMYTPNEGSSGFPTTSSSAISPSVSATVLPHNHASQSGSGSASRQQVYEAEAVVLVPVDEEAVKKVKEMGFQDEKAIREALKKTQNHVDSAVGLLCSG